jgi:hypothetical protein
MVAAVLSNGTTLNVAGARNAFADRPAGLGAGTAVISGQKVAVPVFLAE